MIIRTLEQNKKETWAIIDKYISMLNPNINFSDEDRERLKYLRNERERLEIMASKNI